MVLHSEETRRQYLRSLKLFFGYLQSPGGENLEEQAKAFLRKAREEEQQKQSIQDTIVLYLDHQRRTKRKGGELAPGTLKNFYKPIKAFYDAHSGGDDLPPINWKRISRVLPRAKNYSSSDRIPTIEEIRKLVEYPDRRIKPIVYVMCSSGIRLGAWDYLKWKHVTPIPNEGKKKKAPESCVKAQGLRAHKKKIGMLLGGSAINSSHIRLQKSL
jgi:hypothetical protein